jgi:hypothetical protein
VAKPILKKGSRYMEPSDIVVKTHKIPLPALFLVFLPFAFVFVVMLYAKFSVMVPKSPSSTCLRTQSGVKILSKTFAGTLEYKSGSYVVKEENHHLTLLAKCGQISCRGPYHALRTRPLHQPIVVAFCGNELMSVMFADGNVLYPPSKPERP